MTVYVVSLEWDRAPSEFVGHAPVEGVFASEQAAQAQQATVRAELEALGYAVYDPEDDADDWQVDVHVTPHEVAP